MSERARFWSDTFDGDLLALVPGTDEALGDAAGLLLYTHGSRHAETGRLHHPSVWNHQLGLVAFFGYDGPAKPRACYTAERMIECTLLEAVRCAWAQSFVILLHRRPIFDGGHEQSRMMTLLYRRRGMREIGPLPDPDETIIAAVLDRLRATAKNAHEILVDVAGPWAG